MLKAHLKARRVAGNRRKGSIRTSEEPGEERDLSMLAKLPLQVVNQRSVLPLCQRVLPGWWRKGLQGLLQ